MGEVIATEEQWNRGDWMLMSGRVLDPGGNPVAGARIDIWQADQPASTTSRTTGCTSVTCAPC